MVAVNHDGADLIAIERERQAEIKGWTPEHDDQWGESELLIAASGYLYAGHTGNTSKPMGWPWHEDWWRPSEDPIRNLVKAGALIAAEIDRLQRAAFSGRDATDG